MIELLIKYIRDKGYRVDVLLNALLIRKQAKGKIFGVNWAIFSGDLRPDFEEWLYYMATRKCDEIEKAIAEYDSQPPLSHEDGR